MKKFFKVMVEDLIQDLPTYIMIVAILTIIGILAHAAIFGPPQPPFQEMCEVSYVKAVSYWSYT